MSLPTIEEVLCKIYTSQKFIPTELKPKPFEFGPKQLEWISSLKNNPERQLIGRLGIITENGYKTCCLGELGIITGVCEWGIKKRFLYAEKSTIILSINGLRKKVGLYTSTGDAYQKGKCSESIVSLSVLNDKLLTWPEIAVYLEHYGGYYFIKAV